MGSNTTNTKVPKSPKYRPVLTEAQILHILTLAKREKPLSYDSISLLSSLAPFLCKIQNRAVAPSSIPNPRVSTNSLEALGGAVEESELSGLSKEEIWDRDYAKYKVAPESCTLVEIENAREYMYLNDLMSVEEVVVFESISGNVFKEIE